MSDPESTGLTTELKLPAVVGPEKSYLKQVTDALGVPREVLASDAEILHAWNELPRLLQRIPEAQRTELHVRMCVAVSTGLFDAAINYAWNSAIVALREKVRSFGLNVVPQIIENEFDEGRLLELTDHDLLELCLSLNLISEDAHFFLNQNREIRNNFSTAHPPIGSLDDDEFIVFLSRCARYALSDTSNPRGVDTPALITSVKGRRHTEDQREVWAQRIRETHDAQRTLIITSLHGIYCDPESGKVTRDNCVRLCQELGEELAPKTESELINRHSDYLAKGDTDRVERSQDFFREVGILHLLNQAERHTLVSAATQDLLRIHRGWDNFHNEPPLARRLREIVDQVGVPDSVRDEYVDAVTTCAVGNPYGVSHAALPHYEHMIRSFGPSEIERMLYPRSDKTTLGSRLKGYERCRERYRELVSMLDAESVPREAAHNYKTWIR